MNNTYSDLQSKVFDWLRFPLIVGVVFIHCFGEPFDFSSLDLSQPSGLDFYNFFRVSISKVLTHVCVPVFFFISGSLFFIGLEKWSKIVYLKKIKKRIKSLFVPFLLWNLIGILSPLAGAFRDAGFYGIHCFFEDKGYWHLFWDCEKWNLDGINWIGGGTPSSSPYLIPLWFLRDLIVVSLCSPILYFFLNFLRSLGVLLLALCYISGIFLNIPGVSSTAFFFFGAGAFFRLNNIDVTKFSYKYRWFFYISALVLWILCTLFNGHNTYEGNLVYPIYVIIGSVALLNLATTIVHNNIITMPLICSKSSFFIYLSHTIWITRIVTLISQKIFGGDNALMLFASYMFVPLTTIAICILLYSLLSKFMPKVCKILLGGR